MTPEAASDIAISGLQFIASDPEQLTRFVALSGISPDEIRTIANTAEFMIAVLDYFLTDEPTLLAFTASANIGPGDIMKAKIALDPGSIAEI